MSYNNNWAKELKETFYAINKDSEQLDEMFGFGKKKKETPKPKANKPAKPAKPAEPVKPAESPLDANAMDYALGLGGTRYEHVEHEGNNLQEEMALNEDLLMLIGVLCEELGIDVEDLLNLDEGSRGSKRLLRKTAGIAERLKSVSELPSTDPGKFDATRVLANRALETQNQIDSKLKTSTKRASRRAVASAVGDKPARQADAKMKAKTGETTGEHASRNLGALRQASRTLGDMNVKAVGRRAED